MASSGQLHSRSSPYHYQSLEGAYEFRLIKVSREELAPKHENRPTYRYDIIHADLDTSAPSYETVSYVWGVGSRDERLTLGSGAYLLITTTLATAIYLLSEQCYTGYLWIDQICINQEDIAERSKQVALVGYIYSRCQEVLIKLHDDFKYGQFCQASKDFLSTAEDISQEELNIALETSSLRFNWEEYYVVTYLSNDMWFKRAWVFQEYVLPPRAQFTIKNCAISPVTMSRLVGFSRTKFPNSASDNFGNFETMKEERSRRLAMGWNQKPLYLFLAEVVPGFQATDPHDLIYAFLGLRTSSMAQAICPNYTLDYETVLVESTIAIMKESASLTIFSVIENETRRLLRDSKEQIPTWVVDWKACSVLRITIDFHDVDLGPRHFHTTGKRQYNPVYDFRLLKAPGKGIDFITYILGSELNPPVNVWGKTLHDEPMQYHPATRLRVDMHVAKINVDQGLLITCDRFIRVVLADCSHRYELGNDFLSRDDIDWTDYHQFYSEWKATLGDGFTYYKKEHQVNPYLYAMEICVWVVCERRVFVTANGRLGLGPKEVQIGDQISLPHGSTTPIILRRSNKPGDILIYTVVGDCYLENVMFGGAMNWEEDTCDWFTLA